MAVDFDSLVEKVNLLPVEIKEYVADIRLEDINSELAWLGENEYDSPVLEILAIEVLEDIESLEKAKSETEYFVDFEDYRKERLAKMNVNKYYVF